MKKICRDMVRGGQDSKTSMARIMAWMVLTLIFVSWFYFPERPVTDLVGLFAAILGYVFSGKWVYHKSRRGNDDSEL